MPTYQYRNGKIRARVRVTPFPAQTKTFDRKEDAKLWAEPLEADLKKKKRAGLLEEDMYTYSDLIDDYLTYALPDMKTNIGRRRQEALWWRAEIGDRTLAEVRTIDIAQVCDRLAQEPLYSVDIYGRAIGRVDRKTGQIKRKSPATIKMYLHTLSAMCHYNINKRGWLRSNPVTALKKPALKNERIRFLSDDERVALLNTCERSPNRQLYPIVLFALCTGARRGEVLKLTLADLDPELTVATLRDTKNGDTRSVHITPMLRPCLLRHLAWLDDFYSARQVDTHWIFPRRDGQAPIDIRKAFENARKLAAKGTPSLGDFRMHDLRHTFASYLAMSGASLVELKHALGHRSLKAVQRYAHLTEDHTRDIIVEMERRRFAIVTSGEAHSADNDNEEGSKLEEVV